METNEITQMFEAIKINSCKLNGQTALQSARNSASGANAHGVSGQVYFNGALRLFRELIAAAQQETAQAEIDDMAVYFFLAAANIRFHMNLRTRELPMIVPVQHD